MASCGRKTARVGLIALAGIAASVGIGSSSIRLGYLSEHEAIISTAGVETVAIVGQTLADVTQIETSIEGSAVYRLTGLVPDQETSLRCGDATGAITPTLRLIPAPRPPGALRIKLTGAIPLQPVAADLDLVAAALQAQDAHATVAIGGLFSFEPTENGTAAGYLRAARRRLTAPSWQGVWRSGAHYGVLGALDYGPLGANRHWSNRLPALEAFAHYWPPPNRPLDRTPAAYEFTLGDIACFVLDGFSQADGVEQTQAERKILGTAQLHWLANALALSKAPFKLVFCGRPLLVPYNDGAALHSFTQATRQFLGILDGPGTDGVLLVTGGGQVGELTRFIRSNGYPLNELSLGPLAGNLDPEKPYEELNYFRVPGTLVREPHFALLEISGAADERRLRLSTHQLDGTELWAETIEASELANQRYP